jgi:hypothetical protein
MQSANRAILMHPIPIFHFVWIGIDKQGALMALRAFLSQNGVKLCFAEFHDEEVNVGWWDKVTRPFP